MQDDDEWTIISSLAVAAIRHYSAGGIYPDDSGQLGAIGLATRRSGAYGRFRGFKYQDRY